MIEITTQTAQMLVNSQFPQWKHLPIRPVEKSGHDNRTFHLGDKMTIRLPSDVNYVAQVEKEIKWLPMLQKFITLPISSPIAKGQPESFYPFPWSVNHFIEGETVSQSNIAKAELAICLKRFLKELQAIDTAGAPLAGKHNFYRGGDLSVYHEETETALAQLKEELPVEKLRYFWERAMSSEWTEQAVWVHGDIAPGNLLVHNRTLCAVIDFGVMGVGDPACDYAMAWTFFDEESRNEFLRELDAGTIDRARGWALWKALITYHSENTEVSDNAKFTIQSILSELM